MAAKMTKTKIPGVFRRGKRYVVTYRDPEGRQRKESVATFDQARQLKATREHEVRTRSFDRGRDIKLAEYARSWIEDYRGKKTVIRPRTKKDYRQHINTYVLEFFNEDKKLADVTPGDVDRFVAWMVDGGGVEGRELSSKTIRRVLVPFRGFMEAAYRDGLIVSNPVTGVPVPVRSRVGGPKEVRVLSPKEISRLLAELPDEHRLFVEFIASTGLRWSEAIAVRCGDIDATAGTLRVERSADPGREIQATKSLDSVREVRLSERLLVQLLKQAGDDPDALLFKDADGKMLAYPHLREYVLIPAAKRAGLPVSGFHIFRHSAASLLFSAGRNPKEVQEFLGHSNAAFTLSTYIHLLEGSEKPVIDLN